MRAGDQETLPALLSALLGEREPDDALIAAGLSSPDESQRDVALDLAARHLLIGAPHLVREHLRLPAARKRIARALAQDPLLSLERRPPGDIGVQHPQGPEIQRWFARERVGRILSALERAGDDPQALEELCSLLPGLHQLAALSAQSPLPQDVRSRLAEQFEAKLRHRYPPQIGIVPSYYCDRSCPYCFTRTRRREGMSLPTLRSILDRVDPDGSLVRVNVFGGEPTQFEALPAFIEEFQRRGLSFFFSTHGIADPDLFARIVAAPNLDSVTFHVEAPGFYGDGELATLLRNARALSATRRQAIVRYNLVEPDRRDWSFLAPVLEALPGAFFSFAVTFPSPTARNVHATLGNLSRFGEKIVALTRFFEESLPQARKIALAKPFPLCAFSQDDLRYLLSRVDYRNICEIDRNGFTDQIQITPELKIIPCMAVSAPEYCLDALAPMGEMGRAFAGRVAALSHKPMLPACAACSLFESGACQAACFAYVQGATR